jgi:Fe-S oxidoreductase
MLKSLSRLHGKVVFFAGCMVNYQITDVGKAAMQVLEKNGIEVAFPTQQCCGMPSFDLGNTSAMAKAATANLASLKPWLERGYDVVVPVPSCSLMLKREYPTLVPGNDTAQLSKRTFDICEYLMRLKMQGLWLRILFAIRGVWPIRSRVTFVTKISGLNPKSSWS